MKAKLAFSVPSSCGQYGTLSIRLQCCSSRMRLRLCPLLSVSRSSSSAAIFASSRSARTFHDGSSTRGSVKELKPTMRTGFVLDHALDTMFPDGCMRSVEMAYCILLQMTTRNLKLPVLEMWSLRNTVVTSSAW